MSRIEIDLARLERNVAALRGLLASDAGRPIPTSICGVIKKDAYGLGAGPVAHRLVRAGVGMLAVYSAEEAADLIGRAVTAPLLMLMPIHRIGRTEVLYRQAVAGNLHLSIHEPRQVAALDQLGRRFGLRLPVHPYADTGMSRSGLSAQQFSDVLNEIRAAGHLHLAGVYTHLAAADEDPDLTETQRARFDRLLEEVGPLPGGTLRHMANTCGAMRDPRLHLDMIRPGLGLLGYGREMMKGGAPPAEAGDPPRTAPAPVWEEVALEPVVRWVSRVIHVQRYPAGATVGYGATHRLSRESVLGVVPVGYGDGYPLGLGNRATVRVNPAPGAQAGAIGFDAPLLGRVNMDQIVLDLTAAEADADSLREAEVELIGGDPAAPHALPRLAELAGTHSYEMLCRLGPHLPRKYVG